MPWWAVSLAVTLRGRRCPGTAVAGAPGRRRGGFRRVAGLFVVLSDRFGVSAGSCVGREGLFARVMTAGAVRVIVSFGPAWPKVLGDLDLRARCRPRSVMVRNLAILLVRAL
jgi:hypothetical protein